MKRIAVVLGVAVLMAALMAAPAGAVLLEGQFTQTYIQSPAGISLDGSTLTVSGTVACTPGQRVSIDVSVVQNSTHAFAVGGMQGRCTGHAQQWSTQATVEGNPTFEAGTAEVCATARTRTASGGYTDHYQACSDIAVQHLLGG